VDDCHGCSPVPGSVPVGRMVASVLVPVPAQGMVSVEVTKLPGMSTMYVPFPPLVGNTVDTVIGEAREEAPVHSRKSVTYSMGV